MGLGLGLRLWGSTAGHPSNSWASCLLLVFRSDHKTGNRIIKQEVVFKVSSVTFCTVAKRYLLAKNCLKEQVGNQGQKVYFLGRSHIYTSSFSSTATETAVLPYFCPYSPAIGTRW